MGEEGCIAHQKQGREGVEEFSDVEGHDVVALAPGHR